MVFRIVLLCLLLVRLGAQAPPPGASDAQMESEIRQKLSRSVIGKDGFTVRVKGGIVYWEGSTHVSQHKGAATRMAKSSGAKRVVNQIRVIGGKAPAKVNSASKAQKPTAQLHAEPEVPEPLPELKRVAVRWVPSRH